MAVLLFVRIVNGTKMFVKTHVGRVQLPHSGAVHPRQLLLEEDNNELEDKFDDELAGCVAECSTGKCHP